MFLFIDTLRIAADSSITVTSPADTVLIHELKKTIYENRTLSSQMWTILSSALLFLMVLGFACLETGLTRSKNAAHVLFKYTLVPIIVFITFLTWGFNLMYPDDFLLNKLLGAAIPGIKNSVDTYSFSEIPDFSSFLLYQALLACISTLLISGAVAERIKLSAFLIFSFLFAAFIYPIIGMWHWGNGWLNQTLHPLFYDFAGTSVVHISGGFAALVAAALLGPRLGKYAEGRITPIMGHNIPFAGIGLFMLWLGWIGFTGGAILFTQPEKLSYVILITFISGTAGGFGAFLVSYFIHRTHDLTMLMNGVLSGLVAISASANIMNPTESLIIGLISGIFVVFSVLLFDRFRIDDPVGAISVHLMCGIWGTLAVGIFGPLAHKEQFISQLIGLATIGITVGSLSLIILFLIRSTIGLRLSVKDELEGLDINEHGMKAYNQDVENN